MNVTLEQTGNISIFKSADGCTVTVIAPEGSRDSFESIGNGFWKWVRKCDTPVDRMTMQIRVSKTPEYFLVPAINYNGNGWGSGAQYSGYACEGGLNLTIESDSYQYTKQERKKIEKSSD